MSFGKNGVIDSGYYSDNIINPYDKELYIEPDGSLWIRIFHHNNPANALFASSDPFTTMVYKDADRWFNVAICNQVTTWELMVKQALTNTATESKYRWIQTVNPMTATYNNTTSANVTKITTTGYSSSSFGGYFRQNANNNTYLCGNSGSSSQWFGAVGCWTVWNGGIPGYGSTSSSNAVTTGYIDLYLRVDSIINSKASINNDYIQANDFIEY